MKFNLTKTLDRLVSVASYVLPFLELYLFFNPFLRSYRISPRWLEEAAILLRENSWVNYLVFAIVITMISFKRLKISYFSRYNLMQSVIILFAASFLDTADYLFPYVVRGQGSIIAPFFSFLCFGCLLLIIYCVIFAILGKIPEIPVLSEAVRIQIEDY